MKEVGRDLSDIRDGNLWSICGSVFSNYNFP
jgi:hypothetical protein